MCSNWKNLSLVNLLISECIRANWRRDNLYGMKNREKNWKWVEWWNFMLIIWNKFQKLRLVIYLQFLALNVQLERHWHLATWTMLWDVRVCMFQTQSWVWQSVQQIQQALLNSIKLSPNSKEKTPPLQSMSIKSLKKSSSAEWASCIYKYMQKEWKDSLQSMLLLELQELIIDKQ